MFTSEKYTDKVLELYRSGRLGEEACDIVRGWLLSGDSAVEKGSALERMFDREMGRGALSFDDYTRSSLARLHVELGFAAVRMRRRGERVLRWIAGLSVAAAVAVWSVFVLPAMFGGAPTTVVVADSTLGHEVALPDGSTVKLMPGTRLNYNGEGFATHRAVEIDGEGLFSVVGDGSHPFTVSAGEIAVRVLGTEFRVDAPRSGQRAEVALRSGRVEVALGDNTLALEPSQRVAIDRTQGSMERETVPEGEMMRLWGLGLSFDGVRLAEAFERMGEYFGVTMGVDGDLPATEEIVASLDADTTLEDALFVLWTVAPVFDYTTEGDSVTITGKL